VVNPTKKQGPNNAHANCGLYLGGTVSGPDLNDLEWSLTGWDKDLQREKMLAIMLGATMRNPKIKKEVDKLLKDELAENRIPEHLWKGPNITILDQVGVLLSYSLRCSSMVAIQSSGSLSRTDTTTGFCPRRLPHSKDAAEGYH